MSLKINRPRGLQSSQYPKSLISNLKGQMESFPKVDLAGVETSKFKRNIGFLLLILSITLFAYLAYNAFKYSNLPTNMQDIPIVKADHTPVRVVPTDPGGEQILNQDKLIYNNLQDPHFKRGKKQEAQIEDEMRMKDADLRSPKQVLKAKSDAPKPRKKEPVKSPFEVLGEGAR